jgi:RHS repeat-associated protein
MSVTTSGATKNYVYDAAGNEINDGMHSYVYDAENRLVSVDGGAVTYSYDHQNRRMKKVSAIGKTLYIWEGLRVMAEYDGLSGALLVKYVYAGSRMVAKQEGANTRYFLKDRLSVRVMLDGNGNVMGRQAHLPFGEEIAASGEAEKHRFTGYERDAETALDYAVNRYDNSVVGRFTSVDKKASSAKKELPQSWNRYTYTLNNPINLKDPSGLDPFDFESGGRGPCDPFGPARLLDGFEISREILCWAVLISAAYIANELLEPPQQTCGDFLRTTGFAFSGLTFKVAQAVFFEYSGDTVEGIAIARVILNRLWYLNQPDLPDTREARHGFGPKNATVEQVLGAREEGIQFPEYNADGSPIASVQRRYDSTLNGPAGSGDCLLLFQAFLIAGTATASSSSDPFASQGGSWYFAQARFRTPGRMCRDCSAALDPRLGAHWFYTFPYGNYTRGRLFP